MDNHDALPKNPRQLHWTLARKLGHATLIAGLITAGISYRFETYRVEQAVFEQAVEGAKHFESPAMRMLADASRPEVHGELVGLIDRKRFVGLRVFAADRTSLFERWSDISADVLLGAKSQRHDWPKPGKTHRHWSETAGQKLIQVVLPLMGAESELIGYLEITTLLDEKTLREQRDQIRNGVLLSTLSIVIAAILLYPLLLGMLRQSVSLSRRLLGSHLALITALGNAVAKRDSDTDEHNYRVTYYAVSLAEAMNLKPAEIANLVLGAFLHDVGKIGIPDRLLLKRDKLTPEEFEIMKTHVSLGLDIVADSPWLRGGAPVIHYHHEYFDGRGYPAGLHGETIPLVARIFAIADVFDALTSERPYKRALPFAEAMAIMREETSRHFDPAIMATFNNIITELHSWAAQASTTELRHKLHEIMGKYFDA